MTILTKSIPNEIISTTSLDHLIAWRTEQTIKFCVWAMVITMTIIIGIISPKLEHALVFAFVMSIVTIAFFVIG